MTENDAPACCSARRPSSCWIAWGLAFLVVVGVLSFRDYFGAKLGHKPAADPTVGRAAPAFEATTTEGRTVRFPDDYRGKLVLLDFWATWCGPCVGQIPHLKNAQATFHDQGLAVLGVSMDKGSRIDQGELERFVERQEMNWPQIYNGVDAIAERYNVRAIPAAFLIDGDTGKILAAGDQLHGHYLSGTIADALAKRNATTSDSQPATN